MIDIEFICMNINNKVEDLRNEIRSQTVDISTVATIRYDINEYLHICRTARVGIACQSFTAQQSDEIEAVIAHFSSEYELWNSTLAMFDEVEVGEFN